MLCLLFRVANLRMSHVIEAHVRATVVSHKVTEEGEIIPYHQTELKVSSCLDRVKVLKWLEAYSTRIIQPHYIEPIEYLSEMKLSFFEGLNNLS